LTEPTHWQAWHEPYADANSYLSQRLAVVQSHIHSFLDAATPGPIRVVSLCAGEGRDLLGVLPSHARREDVHARLVELDPGNAAVARAAARDAGLSQVEVVVGDAAMTDAYAGAVPAELVLACGVFGNIVDADIRRTIEALPQLCAPHATVIWTRHRLEPDLTPTVRGWFGDSGFTELAFDAPEREDLKFSVGVNRYEGAPVALQPGVRMFEFVIGNP
jgi:hypothetical protein